VDVTRDLRWVGRDSFYVEHGDWFVLVCACVAFLATALLGTLGAPPASTGELKK
jgi:apolipoprotein N-acyltransferase